MNMFIENIRMAVSSLKANKSRAALTMLGIIIGIAAVIAIVTVGNSLTISVSSSMQAIGANNISATVTTRTEEEDTKENGIVFGTVSSRRSMTEDDYITDEMIEGLFEYFGDEIAGISASETSDSYTIQNGKNQATLKFTGVSQGYFIANDVEIISGRLFTDSEASAKRNVALVADSFVDKIFDVPYKDAVGKEITATLNNQEITFVIVGVYKYDESSMGMMMGNNSSTTCYIPLTTVQKINHSKNYPSISIVAGVGTDSDSLTSKIENYLGGYYRSNKYYTVRTFNMASMMSVLSDMLGKITLAISIVAGIALLVGGIGVMNIMLVSITERTREIGTRKALGATNSSIRTQFIIEAVIICMIGGAIGIVLGVAGGMVGANLIGFKAAPSISSIIGSLLFSMIIGIFFGYYPANKAAKMNPIDALRYE